MENTVKSEALGYKFLKIGFISILILEISAGGIIPYVSILGYLFLIFGLLFLKFYSKLFSYSLFLVLASFILALIYNFLYFYKGIKASYFIMYIARLIDIGVLLLICAAIKQLAYRIKNNELIYKCYNASKSIVILIFVIAAFTIRLDLLIIKVLQLGRTISGMAAGLVILPLIYLPFKILQQTSSMINLFRDCLKSKS